MRSLGAFLLVILLGCGPHREPPRVPPPYPRFGWITPARGATVRPDGVAYRFATGPAAGVAWDTLIPPPGIAWELRTQIWRLAGSEPFGVAVGVRAGSAAGCALQIRGDGAVRMVRLGARGETPLAAWRPVASVAPEPAVPDPETGARVIREVALRAVADRIEGSLDGEPIGSMPLPSSCRGGRVGLYAGARSELRVPYFTLARVP